MNNSDCYQLDALASRVASLEERTDRLEKLTGLQAAQGQGRSDGRESVLAPPAASHTAAIIARVEKVEESADRHLQDITNLSGAKDEIPAGTCALESSATKGKAPSDLGQSEIPDSQSVIYQSQAASPVEELTGCTISSSCQDETSKQSVNEKQSVHESNTKQANGEQPDSLEARIGLYWLSKLGIGFLVVGVSLLIMYTFKNFGPQAKVATGFVVASILLAIGEYLERRDSIPWYARLLEGGAWALGFFTTYAMHHVASVRIIADPLTDLILMLGMSGLAITHATNKRSEIMAIFSVTLGFLTLALSHVTGFTAIASAILVFVSTVLSIRNSWYQLYLYSIFASYGALIACGSLDALASGSPAEQLRLTTLLLAPGLIGFGIVPALCPQQNRLHKRTIEIGTVINIASFCALFFPQAYDCLGTGASIYNLTIALWLFILAALAKHKSAPVIARINSLFALTIGTLYFPGNHFGHNSWLYLAGELAVLSWAGLYFNLKSFRWFAIALGAVLACGNLGLMFGNASTMIFGQYLPFTLVSAISAICALSLAAYLQKYEPLKANLSQKEGKLAFYSHWHWAVIVAWFLPMALIAHDFQVLGSVPEPWQTPLVLYSWLALALLVMGQSIKLISPYMQVLSIILFATVGLPACASWHFSWAVSLPAVAVMFAAAFVFKHFAYRLSKTGSLANFRSQFLIAYCCAALLPSAATMPGHQTTAYLSIMALLALGLGLRLPDKFIRLVTPAAFGLALISMCCHPLELASVIPAVASLYLGWALYRLPAASVADGGEKELRHVYSGLGAFVLTLFFAQNLPGTWISLSWALEALTILLAGMALKEQVFRITGLLVFCALLFRMLFIEVGFDLDWAFVAPVIACMYLGWAAYRLPGVGDVDKEERELRHIYSVAAGIVLTVFLGHKLGRTWISCAWALEGFAMLALGFLLREKVMRISALWVFATLVYRLLFIDLASAETVYRIFAFIVAGLVLLLSAYAYTWFARKFGAEDDFKVEVGSGQLTEAPAE